jgi:hypothetical protein
MYWPLLLLFSSWAWSHQSSVTSGGSELSWPNANIPVSIQTNTSDLSSSTARNIILESLSSWNSTGVVNLSSASSSNNQIKFESDFSIYGSAVVGVTEISYNASGAINKAVVLLNDNYNFTADKTSFGDSSVYLGDVVTHELGHFLGLSHSEVLDSSMFYSSFPGQSSISPDDRAGILQKYGTGKGSIQGSVQGGNHIGVLGVHVQIISRKTGAVIGVISDEDGHFYAGGLDLDDTYYIYTSPLKNLDSLPSYLSNSQSEFCPGSYVGSFFTACGREAEGIPQGINLSSGNQNVDVGVVTINCSLKASEEYSAQKIQSTFDSVMIWQPEEGDLKEKAYVGYFNPMSTSSWSQWETLQVDLTGVAMSLEKKLVINFISRPFGSLLQYEMRLWHNGALVGVSSISQDNLIGTFDTDMSLNRNLSASQVSNNFEIQIRARKLSNSYVPLTFPAPGLFTSDEHLPYLLVLGIWQGTTPLFNSESVLSDNSSCLEAPYTYQVSNSKSLVESPHSSIDSDAAASAATSACGTLGPPDGGGGSGTSVFIVAMGFMLALFAGNLGKKSKNFLS